MDCSQNAGHETTWSSKINRKPHAERRKPDERRDKGKDDDRGNLLGELDTKYAIALDDGNEKDDEPD